MAKIPVVPFGGSGGIVWTKLFEDSYTLELANNGSNTKYEYSDTWRIDISGYDLLRVEHEATATVQNTYGGSYFASGRVELYSGSHEFCRAVDIIDVAADQTNTGSGSNVTNFAGQYVLGAGTLIDISGFRARVTSIRGTTSATGTIRIYGGKFRI